MTSVCTILLKVLIDVNLNNSFIFLVFKHFYFSNVGTEVIFSNIYLHLFLLLLIDVIQCTNRFSDVEASLNF